MTELEHQVEALIDRHTLLSVLRALSNVAWEKSRHIEESRSRA
jgi:hypothetical protein